MLSGASLLLLVIAQVSPAGRLAGDQVNVTLLLIIVVVGLALRPIDPARQVSTALLLVTPPLVAEIVVGPGAQQVASPVLLMDATAGLLVFHVTVGLVILPNVSVPLAANCWVAPTGSDGVAGVTVMDASVAAPQVNVALPLMPPLLAVIVVELPACTQVANPLLLLIVATAELPVLQAMELSAVGWPREFVPVAVNGSVVPAGIVAVGGDTVTAVNTAAVQFKVAVPLMLPLVALIVELPI